MYSAINIGFVAWVGRGNQGVGRGNFRDYRGGPGELTVIITWQISFDYILQRRASAADLLSLMSFFDRQGIPEALVRNQGEVGNRHGDLERSGSGDEGRGNEDSESESSVNDDFEDDILMLRNYSFITVTMDATTFEMHGLVQLATRKWLEAHGQLERWKQQYIKNLYAEFPTGEYENWAKCRALFPHAKSALAQPPDGEGSLGEWASLLYNTAWYAWAVGSLTDADKMSVKSMKVRKKQLGQEHEDTLSSMAMVALAYNLGGLWKEAEELEVQVMETRKRVLGQEHPSTLTSMNNLAFTWKEHGRDAEAIILIQEYVQLRIRILGFDHPHSLSSSTALAEWQTKKGDVYA
jgi:hypothetical protein